MAGFGLGLAVGLFVGAPLTAAVMRYAMGLHEKIVHGAAQGERVLWGDYSAHDAPLRQTHTDGTRDLEDEDTEIET